MSNVTLTSSCTQHFVVLTTVIGEKIVEVLIPQFFGGQ